MSILIAIKSGNAVYIAGDREVSKDGVAASSIRRVWRTSGRYGILVGCIAPTHIVSHFKNVHLFDGSFLSGDDFNYGFMRIPMCYRIMHEFEHHIRQDESNCNNDGGGCEINAQFLFARDGSLYSIDQELNAIEVDDFIALGTGSSYAFESLLNTVEEFDPIVRIKNAVLECKKRGVHIDFPIEIHNTTKSDDVITLHKKDFE